MCLRFLSMLLCVFCVLGESPKKKNYGSLIKKLENEISALRSNQATELTNTRAELTKITQRLSTFESIQSALDSTNEAINALTGRMDTARNAQKEETETLREILDTLSKRIDTIESADDATSSLDTRVVKLTSAMTREISDNTKRLELIEESSSFGDNALDAMKKSIKQLSQRVDATQKRNDASMKSMKEGLTNINTSIGELNKNLQTVYDSTMAAALDKIMTASLQYLDACGEFMVDTMVDIKRNVQQWIEYCDWEGMKRRMQEIEYAEQWRLFKDWVYGLFHYIRFWWTQGIQPAIIRQATNLYLGIQKYTAESIEFVHSHMLYHEMVLQSKPYLKMANIAEEYNGYILDGVLILFFFSSLMVLSFVLGLCCDCCCPREPSETEPAVISGQNAVRPKRQRNKRRSHK